jgi:hypothetical protein
MCIFFYFTTKVHSMFSIANIQVLIYLFLIERVHLVHGRSRTSRMQDKMYRVNLAGLLPYCVIGFLAVFFRIARIDETGRCLIGIERQTSMLVIIYDLCINVFPRQYIGVNNSFISLCNSFYLSLGCSHFAMTLQAPLCTNWLGGPLVFLNPIRSDR